MTGIGPTHHPNTVLPPSNPSRNSRQGKLIRKKQPGTGGQVRIIAGQWRGRRLAVADVAGLRPTGDRVRETLFNWLQAHIAGSHCLDLFAGSGALGFEALSRFAASACFVEPDPHAFQTLSDSALRLGIHGSDTATFHQATARAFLASNRQHFDIVFIDPPFAAASQWESVAALVPDHLSTTALIYVEAPTNQLVPALIPHGFCVCREKLFGEVHAHLLSRSGL
jgi:16S rRNA (guanine966-N2)-methyltransferase